MKLGIKAKISLMSLLVGATAAATISASVAWFSNTMDFDLSSYRGSSAVAYFAGGRGTENDPYILKNRNHVYNLAWLQYMNYFVDRTTGNPVQTYFRVDNDINMEGLVIPPIGTSDNPFIGFFNGQSHIISNFKVSNFVGSGGITRKPSSNVLSSDGHLLDRSGGPVNIVGFFGVVGEFENDTYTYDTNTPEIINLGLEDITVQSTSSEALVGLAAGYVNASVSGVAIGSASFDVPSSTRALNFTANLSDYSLIGYATKEFLAKTDVVDIEAKRPEIDDGASDIGGDEYGASIPMKTIYERLVDIKNQTRSKSPYGTSEHMKYLSEETYEYQSATPTNEQYSEYPRQTATMSSGGTVNYYLQNANEKESLSDGSDIISSYSFANRTDRDDYIYLFGSKDFSVSNGFTKHEYKYQSATAYYISKTVSGTTHYLTADGTTGIKDVTQSEQATKWFIENNAIYTQSGQRNYYLSFDGSGLTLDNTTGAGTVWTYDSTNAAYYNAYSGTTRFLTFDSSWQATVTQYAISDFNKTNYLIANGTNSFSRTGSINEATIWAKEGDYYKTTINNTVYYLSTLAASRNNPGLRLKTDNSTALSEYSNGGYTYLRGGSYTRNGSTYYYWLRYDRGWTTEAGTGANNNYRCQIMLLSNVSISQTATTENRYGVYDSVSNATATTNPTYFPLQYRKDHGVKNTNTGYIVSGANYDYTNVPGDIRVSKYTYSSSYTTPNRYSIYNLGWSLSSTKTGASFNDGTFWVLTKTAATNGTFARISDVHNTTTNQQGQTTMAATAFTGVSAKTVSELGLVKYNDARQQFGDSLSNGGNNLYGLHFMDAAISMEHKVSVPKATINNVVYQNGKACEISPVLNNGERQYTDAGDLIIQIQSDEEATDMGGNYEFPEDCIDFNLKENGAINFFAGSYFPGNRTFFSLHRVFRENTTGNKNAITSIKKIKTIYKNTAYNPMLDEHAANYDPNQYILEYDTNPVSYSDSNPNKRGDVVFQMSWITTDAGIANYSVTSGTTSYGACFYFEIPVIPGEYALGSDSNGDGAYLMYLDIGSSDDDKNKVIVVEEVKIDTDTYIYPIGVEFAELVGIVWENSSDFAVFQGGKVAAIIVPASVHGYITFDLDMNTLSCGPPQGKSMSGTITQATFIGDGITVYGNNNNNNVVAVRDSWQSVKTKTTTTYRYNPVNGQVSETYIKTIDTTNADGTVHSGDDNVDDPTTYTITSSQFDLTWIIAYATEATPTDPFVTLQYYAPNDASVSVTYKYTFAKANAQATTGTYTYEFTITSSSDIVVHVGTVLSGYQLKINGNLVSSNSSVNISASQAGS